MIHSSNEENRQKEEQSHAVFYKEDDDSYFVVKDVFGHLSYMAIISNQMLNCYKSIVPDSARVLVYEGEG